MHEVSLNRAIRDYLSGDEIEETTYEDLRQGLARLLVEEKGYPRDLITPRFSLSFDVEGKSCSGSIDLAVFTGEGTPLLALFFCPGEVGSFVRQSLAAARIASCGPFPVVVVTDSMEASVVLTHDGSILGTGLSAIPGWEALSELTASLPVYVADEQRQERERRILYAYSGLSGPCCGDSCSG